MPPINQALRRILIVPLADRLKALRDLRDARVITIPKHDEARLPLI